MLRIIWWSWHRIWCLKIREPSIELDPAALEAHDLDAQFECRCLRCGFAWTEAASFVKAVYAVGNER